MQSVLAVILEIRENKSTVGLLPNGAGCYSVWRVEIRQTGHQRGEENHRGPSNDESGSQDTLHSGQGADVLNFARSQPYCAWIGNRLRELKRIADTW